MKIYAQALFLAILLAIAPAAFAQHETFSVNPDASQVDLRAGRQRTPRAGNISCAEGIDRV
jgi:hypothetical protein